MITTLNYKLGAITNKTQRKAFSIMELIVYMVVVLFLIGVLFFGLPFLINQARVTTAKQEMDTLKTAVTAYQMLCVNPGENITAEDLKTGLTAAKTATQAQAYSDIVSEKIKLEGTDAEEVTTKTKLSEITGNDSDDDWFYTYEIENETEDDNGNIFKVASIKIYKDDENGPRYSTEIPLSSLGSSFSVPIGGIIAYTGSLNTLPLNYHICDGTNGTPDLRDRFIVGAGSSYNLNTIGGTSTNILALNQLPNLADFLNKTIAVQGNNQVNGSNNLVSNLPIRAWSWEYFQKNEGNTHGYFKTAFATIPGTSTSFGQPIENKPPYMALYWVMRIK